jgi:hypothetical protein
MDRPARIVAGEGKDMTDRELLELAAKAAGMRVIWPNEAVLPDGRSIRWNPLTDDGDALRLAVRCDIAFMLETERASSTTNTGQRFTEWLGTDPYAATRRAIVRAAATLGKEAHESDR